MGNRDFNKVLWDSAVWGAAACVATAGGAGWVWKHELALGVVWTLGGLLCAFLAGLNLAKLN